MNLPQSTLILKTLGNIHRLHIVVALLEGERCVNDLLDSLADQDVNISQPALSQGLKKLRACGILGARRDSRNIFYYINDPRVLRILGVVEEMTEEEGKVA